MPSILVVEDHKIMAEVLTNVLRQRGGFEVAGVAGTSAEAMERLLESDVDLALVDVSLPDMNGIELVAMIHKKYPRLPCLMISGHINKNYVNRALAAGARGYVVKEDVHDLIDGIRHVLQGGTYLSKQLIQQSSEQS